MTTKTVDESTSDGDVGLKRPWSKPSIRAMDALHDRIYSHSIQATGTGGYRCVTRGNFCHEDEYYHPVS